MRYSELFGKTNKTAPHDADSANARLLIQGGFINQLGAGIFSYLPLGLRVLNKISNIVREEMNAIGAQEILMPALIPKQNWETTDRWDSMDVNFKLEGHGKEYALGSTHEEVITPLVKEYVHSYKQLPVALYQIQTKFRNEARAKSGLLRGREFLMKDLYSFHIDEDDFNAFYEKSKEAYLNVFRRCGLDAIVTEASGGAFSKYSHEFQVVTPFGEDIIFACDQCRYAQNKEITEFKGGETCPKCEKGTMKEEKAIEAGNIFPLKTRFSDAFKLKVAGEDGKHIDVLMGCYGIGPSRVMGAAVDVHHDENGIRWPREIAPYTVHLVTLGSQDMEDRIRETAESLYEEWTDAGIEVLWDDREASAGEKFADADLFGLPLRIVVSKKTLSEDSVEWKERVSDEARLMKLDAISEEVQSYLAN